MAKVVEVKSDLKSNKNKSFLYAVFAFTFQIVFALLGVGLLIANFTNKISLPIVFPILFIVIAVVMLIIYLITRKKFDILNAGVKGEKNVLGILKHLPKKYTVITNPIIENRGKKYELDFVVVGDKGVFVIETKNYGGVVYGKTSEQKWEQIRYGKNNKTLKKEVNNPVRQVNRQKSKLRELFIDLGINADVFPVIYFSSGSSKLQIEDDAEFKIPILKNEHSLVDYITNTKGKRAVSTATYKKIVRVLKNSN